MANIDGSFVIIQELYKSLSGKETDVFLTYSGVSYGNSKPWILRIDSREYRHETCDGAVNGLLSLLKKEIIDKAAQAEAESIRLRQSLAKLGN